MAQKIVSLTLVETQEDFKIGSETLLDIFSKRNFTASSGTTDGTTVFKLVDSGADFVADDIQVGDIVHNDTDTTVTIVTAIDSLTTLSVKDDIFVSGENYDIIAPTRVQFSEEGARAKDREVLEKRAGIVTEAANLITVTSPDSTQTHDVNANRVLSTDFSSGQSGATGKSDTPSASKLIDLNGRFTEKSIAAGDNVINARTGSTTTVTTVDSDTQLTIGADIFTQAGDKYIVNIVTVIRYNGLGADPDDIFVTELPSAIETAIDAL